MDYYKILELDENASDEDIKKSYRRLAMKYHPDRNLGNKDSEDKFKLIGEAYKVLSDPQLKKDYDFQKNNNIPINKSRKNNYQSYQNNFDDYFSSDFEEIFSNFWQKSSSTNHNFRKETNSRKNKNSNLEYKITLSFWESVLGTTKNISFINQFNNTETFSISIPPGVENNSIIPIQIYNNNIFFNIKVKKDPYFERKNLDLYTEIDLSLTLALLGGTIELPHWNTTYEVNIPEGVENGQLLRLTGAGIKTKNQTGDLYLKCKIVTPKRLTKKQKEILADFNKTEKNKPVLAEKKQSWK